MFRLNLSCKSILVVGASSGIGLSLIKTLKEYDNLKIGYHYSNSNSIEKSVNIFPIKKKLSNAKDCEELIQKYFDDVGYIDGLVVLCGGIHQCTHWDNIDELSWNADLFLNLSASFFLSRAMIRKAINNSTSSKIILFGTESSLHGGGKDTFAYGVAKRGIECMVQGLAKEVAKYNITVNGIRPSFIDSGFHKRWKNNTDSDLKKRQELIPLKRPGTTNEVASLCLFLLSNQSNFITGQMIPITGGDWL